MGKLLCVFFIAALLSAPTSALGSKAGLVCLSMLLEQLEVPIRSPGRP